MFGLENAPQCNTIGAFSATAESEGSSLKPSSTNFGDDAAANKKATSEQSRSLFSPLDFVDAITNNFSRVWDEWP